MTGCYVSPLPTRMQPNYARRDKSGWPVTERVHLWPDGDSQRACVPALCRECWRESNWHDEGQGRETAA